MDPYFGHQLKLIEIADGLARSAPDQSEEEYLRRFRAVYRHLAATVHGAMQEAGMWPGAFGPTGPMPPNIGEFLNRTDEDLSSLR